MVVEENMLYYLNKEKLPTIPTPHDCVIRRVSIQEDTLFLGFEEDISCHDSIKQIRPNAKSLAIKIHLIDTFDVYQLKIQKFPRALKIYKGIDFKKVIEYSKNGRLEYLYHNIGFNSVIIKLWYQTPIVMDLDAGYIEFDWKD